MNEQNDIRIDVVGNADAFEVTAQGAARELDAVKRQILDMAAKAQGASGATRALSTEQERLSAAARASRDALEREAAAKRASGLAASQATQAQQAMNGAMSGAATRNIQNVAYQLQDFAVQVNGGVDAIRALSQQLPQMLVGFGATGAAIGLAAALLPNIVSAFSDGAKGAKTFDTALGDLNEAIGETGQASKAFDMEGLYEEFNKANSATRAAIIEQVRFQQEFIRTRQLVAEKKFGEQAGGLVSYSFMDKMAGSFGKGQSGRLADQLGISPEVAKDLAPMLTGLKNGTEDASLVFQRFGTVLLSGKPKAVELATSLNELAKSQRDAAAASTALSDAQQKMAMGHVTTKKEADAAAKAARDQASDFDLLVIALGKKIAVETEGLQATEKLSAAEKAYAGYLADVRSGAVKLTAAQAEVAEAYWSVYRARAKDNEAAEATRKRAEDAEKAAEKSLKMAQDEAAALLEKARAAETENAQIGLSADSLAYLTRQRYDERLELLQSKAAAIEAMAGRTAEVEAIEAQIDALTRLRDAEVARPKLREQAREWERFTDDINRSLTDALYRAFESGGSFGKTFAKTLENTLKASFSKMLINMVISTGGSLTNSAINAVLGTGGANGGAGTNYLGLASNASSIYNLANGSYAAAAANAYSYGSTALGYTYGTSALSQQSMMLAAQESGMAASSGSAGALSGLSTGTVAWVAAIVMGMYMSSEAWKAGIKWGDFADSYRKTDMYKFDGLAQYRDLMEEPARAILGDDIVDSEFWAIAFGSSLSAQIHEAFATATGNYGAPKTNVNTRFSASALGGITANPMNNGSTAYAGGQESLSGAIFNNAVRLALLRFSPTDAFDVTLAGHINNRGRSSNQKLSEVLQDGDTIYRHRTESGKGMADFQNYANDAIPKMQLAIIAEAMRDSSADYKGVVDMVLGTSKDLTDAIRDMSAWQIGGTLQSLFGIADAFDQVKTGLDGLPVQFADLATVAAQARDAAGVAVQNVQAQIASATAAGDTAAVKTLTDQLAALKSAAAETDAAAVTRVIRETQAFTGVLDMLGQTLSSVFDASNSSKIFALSESLVSVFGTIDALTSAVNGYVENFYTADEKRALQIERIQSRLAQGGLDFSAEQIGNATREQFRDVVEAVKLTGEQGIVAFKALMDVQGAFAALVPVADSLTQSTGRAVDVIVDQVAVLREALTSGFETQLDSIGRTLAANMSALQRAADLERQRATAAQQAAQEQIGAIKSLTGYLRDQISSLLSSDSDALNGMAESARKVIEDAVRASAAGYLPDQATLADAVSTVRQKMSESVYASSAERDYEALKLAGQLQQIKTAGDKQLPIAEQALNAANAQLNAIERSLDFAQKQVDLLRGIDESTLDLSRGIESAAQQLVEQFKTALTGLSQTILGALAAGNIGSADAARQLAASGVATDKITQVGGRPVFVSSQGALVTDDGMVRANSGWKGSIDDARRIVQEAFNAMAPADFYAASKAQGVSAAMIDAMYSLPPGTANDWAKAHGLPAFAQGANRIPQDMLAVVHKDEAIIPAAFNPWAGSAGGNDRLEARIVELIDQNRRLEDRLASIENHTRRTSSTLDSVTEGGNAMRQVPA